MLAAGITEFGGAVRPLDLPEPRTLRSDEVLIEVRASGVGNWDAIVSTGDWDTGIRPPMALGVEAAGLVAAAGEKVPEIGVGDRVATHSVPFREQGAWAARFIAAAAHVTVLPASVPFEVGATMPVPALTADQALTDSLAVGPSQVVLVHGAGGVTGGMLVQLAVHLGASVIATAGPDSLDRVATLGAATVLDYHRPDWPAQVREMTGGGVDAAVSAAPAGARQAVRAVRPGGALATITADLPPPERDISMHEVVVVPDGPRLHGLAALAGEGVLTVAIGHAMPLERAADALAKARSGTHGEAIVLTMPG